MCEILLRVKDKVNGDFYLNTKCTKAGDVIVIGEDGHVWGIEEKKLNFYRILTFPGVTRNDLLSYLASEINTDPQNPSKTLQKRAFKLDINGLKPEIKQKMLDDTRQEPIIVTDLKSNEALALRINKPAITDPNVIGEANNKF